MSNVGNLGDDEIAFLGGHDDDFYGLWEVDWHFNGRRPEWSQDERAAFVSALVQRGLLDVFFGPLQTKRPPLAPDVALQALANPDAWTPPLEGQETDYYVTTSSIGIAAQRVGS